MKRFALILLTVAIFPMVGFTLVIETIEAVVNNELILSGEVKTQALQQAMKQRQLGKTIDDEVFMEIWKIVLNGMIDDLLIMQEIRKSLSEERQEQIRQYIENRANFEMARISVEFNTPEKLAQREKETGLSWVEERQALQRMIYRQYIQDSIAQQFTNSKVSPPTPEEIEAFNENNPGDRPDGSVKIAMIQLNLPPNASSSAERNVLKQAREIVLRARGGEAFEALASQYSQDEASKKYGGHLSTIFKKGETAVAFNPIFDLGKDDISDPIRTAAGFLIFKIVEKDTVENRIMKRKKELNIRKWIQQLREKAIIDFRPRLSMEEDAKPSN